jgi:membrane protein DedA with SNARE-associated domain
MVHILEVYGYWLIFAFVFAENLGVPLPSFPVIILAASTVRSMHFSIAGLVLVSAMGALGGDIFWYTLGSLRGRPILRTLCSLTLNPDSCVSRTENIFVRHGMKSLLVAKFVPGLNTVGPPLAGMLKVSFPRFVLFDLGGILIWSGSAITLGILFRNQVEWVLEWLQAFGRLGVPILGVLIAGWLLLKWVERRRFYQLLEKSRIAPPELKEMLERGDELAIVDLRSDLSYQTEGMKIPGAIHIPPKQFEQRFGEIPQGRPVIMYCT